MIESSRGTDKAPGVVGEIILVDVDGRQIQKKCDEMDPVAKRSAKHTEHFFSFPLLNSLYLT